MSIAPLAAPGELDAKYARLRSILEALGSVLVAFSGGADSALLLKVAYDVLGERAVGAIALSETIPSDEVQAARDLAATIGVRLVETHTEEMLNAAYRVNDADRCYHCKNELFTRLRPLADSLGLAHIAYGVNRDDLGDHRPGQRAAGEWTVRGPLAEAGLTKLEIRHLSRRLGLGTWNKPAMACLASRIPHGQPVSVEAIRMVEEAERYIRGFGFANLRVRLHESTARIEVDLESLGLLIQPGVRESICARLHELGYRYITVDLEGFRSGSTNAVNNPAVPRLS